MVCVTCPRRWGARTGGTGWLCRGWRWRWAQRTERGPGGWPACARPRLSPGVFGSRFPPQFLLFKQFDRTYPAERRGLRLLRRADCAFPSHHRPGGAGPNRPPACGALWKMAQLGKRARATPRQPAGGCARVRRPRFGARLHGKAQSGQRASLMARPGPGRAPSGCQLWAKEVSRTQGYG